MCFHPAHITHITKGIRAVVIEVYHNRVVAEAKLLELPEKPPNVFVDIGDHRGNACELVVLFFQLGRFKLIDDNR